MRLLVIGANGLLGSNVVATALDREWDVHGTYHSEKPAFDIPLQQLDITSGQEVRETIYAVDPDWVINCAAMTDVDGCEQEPEQAFAVNAQAPEEMANVCGTEPIGFLHVSTDYMFDGDQAELYAEDDQPNPIQEYGASKLAGEQKVLESKSDALIARLSFVYGVHRSTDELTGFPAWVRGRLLEGAETPLFTDQHVTPTRAGKAAETFLELISGEHNGTYHVASQSCVTPYEFGVEICEQMGEDGSLLIAGSQADVEREAERPANTCLDVSRLEETLGREQPTLSADLDAIAWAFETDETEGR